MNRLFIILFLGVVFLVGCTDKDNNEKTDDVNETEEFVETSQQSEDYKEKLKLDGEISKVSISKSKGNDTTIFNNDTSIETFNTIFTSAVKENGIVNMSNPEFYIDVVYSNDNKQSFHLWIGKNGEKSTLMKTDDTHTIYTVSKDMADKLNDLIE